MLESSAGDKPEPKPLPTQSKDAYEVYREQVFNALEYEQNPLLVDTEAAELLFLILTNPDFTQTERLKEFAVVSQLTMSRMCRYAHESTSNPSIVKQAEMIHHMYAQVFTQAMVELAKSAPVNAQLG